MQARNKTQTDSHDFLILENSQPFSNLLTT